MHKRTLLWILAAFFFALAVFAGYQILSVLLEYRAGDAAYDQLSQYIQTVPSEPSSAGDSAESSDLSDSESLLPEASEPAIPSVDFDALQALNPDVVGWLYFADLDISYPVAQGPDNEYYLRRLLDGSYNIAGTIFMDYRNDPALTHPHTILYGHNLQNGAMLAPLMGYRKQVFYEAHPTAIYLTPDAAYTLELFSGYATDIYDISWELQFGEALSFTEWLQQTKACSEFQSDVPVTEEDHILTISTCTNESDDARYVLVGRLVAIDR